MTKYIHFLIYLLVFLQACNLDDELSKDTRILVPLAKGSLNLDNLTGDTLLMAESDSSLTFAATIWFDEVSFDSILKIPDTTVVKVVTLKTIKLGKREITQKITLGEIGRKNGMTLPQGAMVPIPPINNISAGTVDLDATNLFESVDVKTGTLTADVFNGLPIDLTDVVLSLKNKNSGSQILYDTIPLVKANQKFVKTYPLDGMTFEGMLVAEIINISSPGTGMYPVKIDTNDALDIKVIVQVDELNSARAIFPAQNLIDKGDNIEYVLNGPELKMMKIKTGELKIIVASTIQDSAYITYDIPEARLNGVTPLHYDVVLPPAPPGDTVYIAKTYKVDNYWYDLTGENHDKVNTFYNHLIMRIDSTGKMMDLSLNDSIYLYYTLYDVIPDYVFGYLGQSTTHLEGNTDRLNVFDKIKNGTLDLEKVNATLVVENGAGADGAITLNEISSLNSKTAKKEILDLSGVSNPFKISRASDPPFLSASNQLEISSNPDKLIEIFPDQINYNVDVEVNPDGNTQLSTDFVYNSSRIKAGLELSIPVSLQSGNLVFDDTLDFSLGDPKTIDRIKEGNFKVPVLNKYPVKASFQIYFMDEQKVVTDSLFSVPVEIKEGIVNPQTQKVEIPSSSDFSVFIDQSRINNLKDVQFIAVHAIFDTIPKDEFVKIYSDYSLDFRIIANLLLTMSFK